MGSEDNKLRLSLQTGPEDGSNETISHYYMNQSIGSNQKTKPVDKEK